MFGCREIKRSLNTSDLKVAKTMASLLAHRIKEVINMAKQNALDDKTIRSLVNKHVKSVKDQIEHRDLTQRPTNLDDARERVKVMMEQQSGYEEALACKE